MKTRSIVKFAAFLAVVAISCGENANSENAVESDHAAFSANSAKAAMPSFNVEDRNGNTVNLQSLKGKKVFVNLWASWCPPCRKEMPSIEKLSQSLDSSKVAFVMISLDDNFDKAKKFASAKNLSLPIFYPSENLPPLFNVQGIPATFIFNEAGELIQQIEGGDDYNTPRYQQILQ